MRKIPILKFLLQRNTHNQSSIFMLYQRIFVLLELNKLEFDFGLF